MNTSMDACGSPCALTTSMCYETALPHRPWPGRRVCHMYMHMYMYMLLWCYVCVCVCVTIQCAVF